MRYELLDPDPPTPRLPRVASVVDATAIINEAVDTEITMHGGVGYITYSGLTREVEFDTHGPYVMHLGEPLLITFVNGQRAISSWARLQRVLRVTGQAIPDWVAEGVALHGDTD